MACCSACSSQQQLLKVHRQIPPLNSSQTIVKASPTRRDSPSRQPFGRHSETTSWEECPATDATRNSETPPAPPNYPLPASYTTKFSTDPITASSKITHHMQTPINPSTRGGLEASSQSLTLFAAWKSLATELGTIYVRRPLAPPPNLHNSPTVSTSPIWTDPTWKSKSRGIGGRLRVESTTFGDTSIMTTSEGLGFGLKQLRLEIVSFLIAIPLLAIEFRNSWSHLHFLTWIFICQDKKIKYSILLRYNLDKEANLTRIQCWQL